MKYKVSVVRKITFLLMTMALAVAMVACEGAVGPKGDPGDPGDPAIPGRRGRRVTPEHRTTSPRWLRWSFRRSTWP